MSFAAAEKIANAVLYEGFLLYPYRKSAVKNQKRWHFGTIAPGDARMQTQALLLGCDTTSIEVKIRFLQGDAEREILLPPYAVTGTSLDQVFQFPSIEAAVEQRAERVDEHAWRFTVTIRNVSPAGGHAMESVHTLLRVYEGEFLSLVDPPEAYRSAAAACCNIGTWPVLAGEEGDHSLLLSSPIILYDYPQVAPESAGDFFDGTEMDEMLTLRVLTLSEEERAEVRRGGAAGRELLERTENLPQQHLERLHGAIRSLRSSSRLAFRPGDRVRLHPRKKADIFDLALDGRVAIVEAVERDFEDRVHLAVTVEDDPGRDLGTARQIGHRFFFAPDEVELL